MLAEPLGITLLVIDVFDKLGVPYLIGGSLASAIYGVARSTLDSDLIADLQIEQVMPLVEMLEMDFSIDEMGLLSHKDVVCMHALTTMIYTRVINRAPKSVRSLLNE